MRNVNNRKDFCCYYNQKNNGSDCGRNSYVVNQIPNVPVLVRLITIVAAMLLSAGSALGQYMVQPMELELQPRAGKLVKTALQINSFDANGVITIDLKVLELSQEDDSEWLIFDPDPNSVDYVKGFDVSKLSSCSNWISLERSSVDIPPLGQVPVEVNVRVPPGVRGFYGAGIIVYMRIQDPESNVALLLRYLVPVLIEIQGRTLRPQIELQNVGMEHVPPDGEKLATTNISVSVENKGPTYSRLKPFGRIEGFQDGHWRLITRAEFRDTGIIPGVKLNLKTDIERPLPSGKYKIAGALYVDGKPAKAIQKEIDFVGDPSLERAPTDAPLDLNPAETIITGLPGSNRSQTLEIYNASEAEVNVQALFALPDSLAGTATSTFKGEDLGCVGWLRIEPQQFTLDGYGEKRVRVIAKIPESAAMHPWHYAVLGLYAHYPDGQTAGRTTTNICVGNKKSLDDPEILVKPGNLFIRDYEPENSKFLVVIDFTNYGQVHFKPVRCRAGLAIISGAMQGMRRVSTTLSTDAPGIMMPLEKRNYSGILDIFNVEEGVYRLEANLEYAPGKSETKQIGLQVLARGGLRTINIVQTAEEIAPTDVIEVQW